MTNEKQQVGKIYILTQQFWQHKRKIIAMYTTITAVFVEILCKFIALDAEHNALILCWYYDNCSFD